MCRKVILTWLVLMIFCFEKSTAQQFAYVVSFTDKNNTPYSLSSPLSYLSARAVARRTRQGIPIDSTDLPVINKYIDSTLALTGGIFHGSSRWFNHCIILVSDSTFIHALSGKSFISSTKLVGVYSTFLHHKPSNTTVSAVSTTSPAHKTTTDATYYGWTWEQTQIVNGNYLHNSGFKGTGQLIAVLDAGFTGSDLHIGFDSLRNSGRILDGRDFVYNDNTVFNFSAHGTTVLSTMAGYIPNNPPNNYIGSAPLASYALYVTEDEGSEQPIELYNLELASERADSVGADIITSSLGYNTFTDPSLNLNFAVDLDGKTTICARGANAATKKGILFVASAGNEGGNPWNMILTPGDADSALTIGSVDATGAVWGTSGYGPNAAGQTKPDVCGQGHFASIFTTGGGLGQQDGTSLSTPQIAGWAACLWQANPYATPYQIRQAIIRCANHYSTPNSHIGYGVPNFNCTEQLLNVANTPPPFIPGNWIAVVPNPFQSEIRISAYPDTNNDVEFRLLDVTGKTVAFMTNYLFKGYNPAFAFPVVNLPNGVYILKVASPTQQQVIRIVKQ